MNKIIQINLAGQAVSIDELAFSSLSKYLKSLEDHFSNTASGQEILSDIESRIAELFYNKARGGSAFITETHVAEAIALMGTPEDMDPADDAEYTEHTDGANTTYHAKSKKLFRDPEDRVLGGVCAGLAAYLHLDASILRIITILLIFAAGVPVILYIILWIAIPVAKTPQDRYRMHGDANTVSDIANNIRNEANSVANSVRNGAGKVSDDLKKNENFSQTASGVASGIDRIFKFLAKVFGAGVLSVLVILGIALSVVLLSNATGGIGFNYNGSDLSTPPVLKSPSFNWIFSISLLSLVLIPIGTICYAVLQYIFNVSSGLNLKGIFIAWLLSLAIFIGISIYSFGNVNVDEFKDFGESIKNMSSHHIEQVIENIEPIDSSITPSENEIEYPDDGFERI